jgi:nucleoside-diphosphate-sugar epimerase
MTFVDDALRAGRAPRRPAPAAGPAVLVAGGGGALGAELLEQLLATRTYAHVRVLVTQDFSATVQGLEAVPLDALAAAPGIAPARTGIVVFDRERHANGRDAAFLRPTPDALPALAHRLHHAGVRHLVVVQPHDAARLPDALKAGLANLDEQAVAALGFEHVVFVRSAQVPVGGRGGAGLQRLADLVLAQLRLMTPQREQPVRARKVAELVAALAGRLPGAPTGTRVMAPEQVWHAAQCARAGDYADAWLAGRPPPDVETRVARM